MPLPLVAAVSRWLLLLLSLLLSAVGPIPEVSPGRSGAPSSRKIRPVVQAGHSSSVYHAVGLVTLRTLDNA
jgi:hypothetical protein